MSSTQLAAIGLGLVFVGFVVFVCYSMIKQIIERINDYDPYKINKD